MSGEIISIKGILKNSINNKYFNEINEIIQKNVYDCNLLYTQVCYLIKLFLLKDFEINEFCKNKYKYDDYKFNEEFIIKIFKLLKTGDLDIKEKDSLLSRIVSFYKKYNLDNNNKFKFTKFDNISSITHITNALSRTIKTTITNNIELNYVKYVKEYINICFTKDNKKFEKKEINIIFKDILENTFYSDTKYHEWINKHKNLILPYSNIYIDNFNELFKKKEFINFIDKYLKDDKILFDLIKINNDDINNIFDKIKDNLKNNQNNLNNYKIWIDKNKNIILNEYNKSQKDDFDKSIKNNPYIFIPYMLYINKYLEKNKSKKQYQIIPIRTNLTPKFIPIGLDSLVDILDSKFLLGQTKNYYHNNNKNALDLFNEYFNFDTKYIKNTLKKGYVFSGLIETNGYEIIYIFNSIAKEKQKMEYHENAKNAKKYKKEMTKNMTEDEINKFKEENELKKKKINDEKSKQNSEKYKQIKQNQKIEFNKILDILKPQIDNLKNSLNKNLKDLDDKYKLNLKIEIDKIDKNDNNYENKQNEIIKKLSEDLFNDKFILEYQYKRDYNSLVADYNNDIDLKYKEITDKNIINDNLMKELKIKMNETKKELKNIKKNIKLEIFDNDALKEIKNINSDINKYKNNRNVLKGLILKIKKKLDLLEFKTSELIYTFNQHNIIIRYILNIFLKIKNMNTFEKFNSYLNVLGNIENEDFILNHSLKDIKIIINLCFNYLSYDICKSKVNLDLITLFKYSYKKISKLNESENKQKYCETINKLNLYTKEFNKLVKQKKLIECSLINLFKERNILSVDEMSKKTLTILDKLNWVVIDPGINSLYTILSKDGKIMSYNKCRYLEKTKRKKILNKIENIKKGEIKIIEDKINKQKRLRTSNDYNNFNDYFTLKMESYKKLNSLYNDEKLNKLKWYRFLNSKRAENDLVNKIKNTFGKDVVLILGDWSMDKKGIKTISTPNKKYEKILNDNFLLFKINEFRTSIIKHNTNIKCENLKIKINLETINIKNNYFLEKLKIKNPEKYKNEISEKNIHKILTCKTSENKMVYINRDKNAVKNMKNIVLSYIKTYKKPDIFINIKK